MWDIGSNAYTTTALNVPGYDDQSTAITNFPYQGPWALGYDERGPWLSEAELSEAESRRLAAKWPRLPVAPWHTEDAFVRTDRPRPASRILRVQHRAS